MSKLSWGGGYGQQGEGESSFLKVLQVLIISSSILVNYLHDWLERHVASRKFFFEALSDRMPKKFWEHLFDTLCAIVKL